jgi:hypothetical protein
MGVVGSQGIEQIIEPEMSSDERGKLERSAERIKKAVAEIDLGTRREKRRERIGLSTTLILSGGCDAFRPNNIPGGQYAYRIPRSRKYGQRYVSQSHSRR